MKIAIVGNGKLSKNYGDQIDTHDMIIRFNHAEIKGYEKLVGTKTTILSVVGETSLSYGNAVYHLSRNILNQVSRIFISAVKRNKKYEKSIAELTCNFLIFRYINYDYYVKVCKTIDHGYEIYGNPSTGINILCYICSKYNRHTIDVYGFDNFKSGHYFDNEKRNNKEFHDLDIEKRIIDHFKKYKNVEFFN